MYGSCRAAQRHLQLKLEAPALFLKHGSMHISSSFGSNVVGCKICNTEYLKCVRVTLNFPVVILHYLKTWGKYLDTDPKRHNLDWRKQHYVCVVEKRRMLQHSGIRQFSFCSSLLSVSDQDD